MANYAPALAGYSVGGDGALSPLAGSPFPAPAGQSAWAAVVDPSGRFAYVSNTGAGTVSVFAVAASSGALTRLDADPVAAGVQDLSLGRALTVTLDPSGRHASFIKDGGFDQVLTCGIDAATGALSLASAADAGAGPVGVVTTGTIR